MRIKIQTNNPLPPLKAWYATNSLEGPNTTISDLKKQICTNVDAIRGATKGKTNQLTFTLDGFELLDVSPLDVLREGDLIVIGLNLAEEQATSSHLGKRKRSSSVKLPLKATSKLKPPPSPSTSSMKNAKPAPLLRPIPLKPPTPRESLMPKLATTNHVPPGQGLPKTQNRNKRRRIKRQAERQSTSAPPPPPGASSVNTLPIPTKRPAADVVHALNNAFSTNDQSGTLQPGDLAATSSDQATGHQTENEQIAITMSSLKNKNKKKGFKNASNRPIPQKIVFNDDVPNLKDDVEMAIVDNILHSEKGPLPRVIPPSEKQARGELPPNMFVTSVDVEAEAWNGDDKPRRQYEELPYGDPDPPVSQPQPQGRFDWAAAEVKLSQGKCITSHDDLHIGMHIGKTDLGINPVTFTPEFLLTVGRITATTPNLLARLLIRPGTADISFSKAAKFAADEVVEDMDEEGEELTFTLEEMAEWRILDI
ncbi:hypothetical protein EYR36_005857 [Pleurotus pulmonarius]|nr:hypothetical protein EYR36_005857 [Pleurotus pulmonarius]KAF4600573.1 hypothetical protein EYR38_005210 [Pleurotus pulmonarius]